MSKPLRSRWTRGDQGQARGLKSEHRDLDEVIDRLIEKPPFDQLQLQRLKKRKLGLKDEIQSWKASSSPISSPERRMARNRQAPARPNRWSA